MGAYEYDPLMVVPFCQPVLTHDLPPEKTQALRDALGRLHRQLVAQAAFEWVDDVTYRFILVGKDHRPRVVDCDKTNADHAALLRQAKRHRAQRGWETFHLGSGSWDLKAVRRTFDNHDSALLRLEEPVIFTFVQQETPPAPPPKTPLDLSTAGLAQCIDDASRQCTCYNRGAYTAFWYACLQRLRRAAPLPGMGQASLALCHGGRVIFLRETHGDDTLGTLFQTLRRIWDDVGLCRLEATDPESYDCALLAKWWGRPDDQPPRTLAEQEEVTGVVLDLLGALCEEMPTDIRVDETFTFCLTL